MAKPRHSKRRRKGQIKREVNLEAAHAQLQRAREQWDEAAVHSWEPADPAQCVSLAFYAYENALVAAAEALGEPWEKSHRDKVEVAAKLAAEGKLKTDVSDQLYRLNDLRKDVSYGEPGSELRDVDLEELVSDLESFIDEVDGLVSRISEEQNEN